MRKQYCISKVYQRVVNLVFSNAACETVVDWQDILKAFIKCVPWYMKFFFLHDCFAAVVKGVR